MVRFNPPPDWPIPAGWSPPPQWQPDPAWPPAPAGWQFWVDDPTPDNNAGVGPPARRWFGELSRGWRWTAIGAGALLVSAALAGALVGVIPRPAMNVELMPNNPEERVIAPDWPSPYAMNVDFSGWSGFGGIDAAFADDGRTVVLDTHDTVDTWRTKWSGLIQPGPPRCDLSFTGRVRTRSHTDGVPGGFAVGLGTLGPGDPDTAELSGSAVQIDFGNRGFGKTSYPDDVTADLALADLDGQWRTIEVRIDAAAHTLLVDGATVLRTERGGQCGQPVLRVWAGAVEFTDFRFVG